MYAKEYTFTCWILENDNASESQEISLVINTKEKYITFGNNSKFSDGWEETETFIGAESVVDDDVRNTIQFNKITGNLKQYGEYTLTMGSTTLITYNFKCVPAKRLMP